MTKSREYQACAGTIEKLFLAHKIYLTAVLEYFDGQNIII